MDESIQCNCGENKFWYFKDFVRCPKCWREYSIWTFNDTPELMYRDFDKEENKYKKWQLVDEDALSGQC